MPHYIETVLRRGYRFIAPMKRGSHLRANLPALYPACNVSSGLRIMAMEAVVIPPQPESATPDGVKGERMFGIRVLTWATLALLLIALAEYISHRYFMHRRLLDRFGRPDIFQEHAIDHHRDGRTDVGFDLSISRHFLWGSPFIAVVALADWFGALILSAGILGYAILWTKLHRAIHDVETNWAKLLWCYPMILRHHQEHHRRPGRNFAFVFPFTDYLFGTVSRPRKYRELQMKRL